MNLSSAPGQLVLAFGASAGSSYIRQIPVPSQIPVTPGAASYTTGFPPLTMTDVSAGGVAIAGPDVNGILNEMSSVDVWMSAGAGFPYNATFATAIGGYPKGSVVLQASGTAYWLSTVDNNLTDPDTGGAGWIAFAPITLTTTGISGAATLTDGVLNVPNYSPSYQKQVFTSGGTFTIPDASSFEWTIVGGGGAGGAGATGTSGAGGGAGATAYLLATGWTPGDTITVTVGTGGAGVSGADGGAGVASSISSGTQTITTVTAGGGGGGGYGGDTLPGVGGSGGTATNGDADSTQGGDGATATHYSTGSGASGGSSSFGGGGSGGYANAAIVNGNPGTAWGSGGGGGNTTPTNSGGAGAAGIVVVRWVA